MQGPDGAGPSGGGFPGVQAPMRVYAEPFDYGTVDASPHRFDAARLREFGAPEDAVEVLAGLGLPRGDHFEPVAERELEEAELPGCGRALYLGDAFSGFNNTYWLRPSDGSVWMRYGVQEEPTNMVKPVGTSARSFRTILGAAVSCVNATANQGEFAEGFGDLVCQHTIRAVAADPELFEDDSNWWVVSLQEIEFLIPNLAITDDTLTDLVRRDEDGRWYLEHPGFEEDDD